MQREINLALQAACDKQETVVFLLSKTHGKCDFEENGIIMQLPPLPLLRQVLGIMLPTCLVK